MAGLSGFCRDGVSKHVVNPFFWISRQKGFDMVRVFLYIGGPALMGWFPG